MLKVQCGKYFKMALICIFMAFLMTVLAKPSTLKADAPDPYDILREKYKIKLTGYEPANPYNTSDPYISKSILNIDTRAVYYWNLMNKTTHIWDDLQDTSTTNPGDLNAIYSRLQTMATGWATYGTSCYNNPSILSDIIAGMDWLYNNRYNETKSEYGNWWSWEIGIPFSLNDTMTLIYSNLSAQQITNYTNAIDHFTTSNLDDPNRSWAGANRVWMCKVWIVRGIIGKNSVKIQAGSDGLTKAFSYANQGAEGGFLIDGSYVQHTYFAYAGGYGTALYESISDVVWILNGSTWDNTSPDRANMYNWVFKTFEPELFGGQITASARGRDISRTPTTADSGFRFIRSLLTQIEMQSNPYINDEKSMIKYYIQQNPDLFFSGANRWEYQRAAAIYNDVRITPRQEIVGNFLHYNEDRVTHRRPGWLFNIAMHSTRMYNYESFNGENFKGWYTGDGMTYLYLNPTDYSMNFWQTVDPHRLPGITVDRDISRPNSAAAGTPMVNNWVGGTSLDGLYGISGMDFKQHNYSNMNVSAKKSWFMFDNEVVALGAGVSSTSGRTIETIVDNRSLNSDGSNALVVDGISKPTSLGWSETMNGVNWMYVGGTGGYVFPGGATINGLREQRTGKGSDINSGTHYFQDDEFNSTSRNLNWMWMREDNTHYSFTGTALNLTTQQGTIEGAENTTKNILLAPATPEDFTASTKLTFSPTQAGQEAGIIIYLNDDNYVYLSRAYTDQGAKIIAQSEAGGVAVKNTVSDNIGSTIYLRIDKSSNNYTMYASSDGINWGSAIYTCSNGFAGTDGLNKDVKMGLFAQNGTGAAPEITASFDYFHSSHVKNYLTLWKSHGTNPVNDTYSYIMLPKMTQSEVSSYCANPDVNILRNDTNVQAVSEKNLGIIGANFWKPDRVSYLASYNYASVMAKDKNNQVEVAVSDPTQSGTTITIELAKSGLSVVSKDAAVTVLQLVPTIKFKVDLTQGEKGRTYTATFSYDPNVTVGFSDQFNSDQFNSATLDSRWTWVRQDPANWSLTANPGKMRIVTQAGDLWFANNSTKNILLQTPSSDDYIITTKLTFSPANNYQMAGLIVYGDDNNYFEVARSYASGNYFRVLKETGGMGTYQNVPDTLGGTVYLKMVKSGTRYSGYYSSDGITWTQIGTTYTGVTLTNPKVGLFAQHSGTAPSINADFDYFTMQRPGATDQFNSGTLDTGLWSWVREDNTKWSLTANPGQMRITTQSGDLWFGNNSTKNILLQFPSSEDYTITTKLTFSPTNNYQMAGLIVYGDDNNYIEVARGYASGNYFRILKETGGMGVSQNVPDTLGGTVYLKIVKSGTSYSGYYSSEGITWTQIGTTYTGVTLTNPRVGLFAQHSGTAPSINADFDYFTMLRPGEVEAIPVTGVTLREAEVSIKPGETVVLTASVKPDNATNKAVSWNSNNVAVATIDKNGKVTGTAEGTTTVTVTTADGSKTAACTIIVDNTPPVTTAQIGGTVKDGWYNSDINVTLSTTDNRSGVAKTEYRIGTDGNWNIYTEPFAMTQEGTYTIQYRSTDKAGNVEDIKQQTVQIDKTPPVTLAAYDKQDRNGWYNSDVTVTLSAYDSLSGVAYTEYTVGDSSNFITYTQPLKFTEEGIYNIQYRSVDIAGNNEITKQTAIHIDKTAPVTTAVIDKTAKDGWYNSDINVTLSATDNRSGIAKTEYRIGTDGDWNLYTEPFAMTQEGTYTIQYRSTDKAGNVEDIKQQTIQIDKTPPAFNLIVNGNVLNDGDSFEDYMPLTFKVWDNLSDVASAQISVGGSVYAVDLQTQSSIGIDFAGKVGSYTVTITAQDNAGNRVEKNFTFTVTTSIDSMRHLIDRYVKAGDLGGPLVDQLTNNLNQAQHQLDIGRPEQAAKHMEDFIKHLNNDALGNNVKDYVKAILNADAEALSKLWSGGTR